MGHDYTELMSAALDGRLTLGDRAEWNAHLAGCTHCQERWKALHDVDRLFKNAAHIAPAPGFAMRVSARLNKQQSAQHSRQRTFAGVGILTIGALTLLIIMGWLMAWQLPGLSGTLANAPETLSSILQTFIQWLVLLRALGETGQALVGLIPPWGTALALVYSWLLVALALAWSGFIWQITRQRTSAPMMLSNV